MKIILLFVCFAITDIAVETIGARQKRAGGGKNITIELAPYYVSLRQNLQHVCGGAFISKRHVLTAAHCVLDESRRRLDDISVVSGTDEYERTDVGRPIIKISPHEEFLKGNLWFDIAVATLSAHVDWNIKQSRIALPIADIPCGEPVTLTTLQLLRTKFSNPGLRSIAVQTSPLVRNADINDHIVYGRVDFPRTLSKIDGGGPLVYKRRIVGIVSFISATNHHTCYVVNVFKFKTFIENSIADEPTPYLKHSSGLPWPAKRRPF